MRLSLLIAFFACICGLVRAVPLGVGVPSSGEFAGKFVNHDEAGNPQPIRVFGVNYYDGFLRYIRSPEDLSFVEGFAYLRANQIPVARVLIGGFWAADWKLYFEDKSEYYRRLDDFVEQAEQHEIGLIPNFFWHISTVGEVIQDAVDAGYLVPGRDFQPEKEENSTVDGEPTFDEYRKALGRPESGSIALIRYVTREVVERYKGSPAIWGWEFSNETNLSSDLPNINQFRPKAKASLGFYLVRDDPSVPVYQSDDDLVREDIHYAKRVFAETVREFDEWRFIATGDAMPRNSAYNNWKLQAWGRSSRTELAEVVAFDNPEGYDSLTIHVYTKGVVYFEETSAVSLDVDTGDSLSFLSYFKELGDQMGKPLFVGEWGAMGDGETAQEKDNFHRQIEALLKAEVQLSLIWTFDNRNVGQRQQWWVNPGLPKAYQLSNEDPELWDLRQVNEAFGVW